MLKKEDKTIIRRVINILDEKTLYKKGDLSNVVVYILSRVRDIKKLTSRYKTPFYVFDKLALDKSIDSFLSAFNKEIPQFKAYYAVKINHHPLVVKRAIEKGMGLDVASSREIDIAISAGCKDIVYFSPGKTEEDLQYALKYNDFIAINVDSFNELKMLGFLTSKYKKRIKVGVRIHTDSCGDWKKYGIDIKDLNIFWQEAEKYPLIDLCGIHFHMSRNKNAVFYENTIRELGFYLEQNFSKKNLDEIKYIDFGGGFEVYESEGYYPYKTPRGSIIQTANSYASIKTDFKDLYYILDSIKIEEYAKKIGQAINKYLLPIVKVSYYSEPGRIICNDAMFIALSVADVKDKDNIILNGGVNMVGWQRFENEYFPLINISSPAKKEVECNMWGNLCTTWDIWGYYCYAKKFKNKDIIIVPNQGALTYSLAQNFIQPIPLVYEL